MEARDDAPSALPRQGHQESAVMAQKGNQEALLGALCASPRAFITYQPLRTEVDPGAYFTIPPESTVYQIAPRAPLDPATELAQAIARVESAPVALFIPGRRFDRTGTRHGQGGGWYDRFLALAPIEWLRIGFCFSDQLSETPLLRQSWDEPVDVLCVVDRATGALSVYETRARMPAFDTL